MPSVTSRSGTTQQAEASPAPINAPMAAQLARFDSRLSVRVGRPDSGAEAMPQILSSDFVIRSVMRSEEHTSELQSLMRISYAVFCLKKKTTKINKAQS